MPCFFTTCVLIWYIGDNAEVGVANDAQYEDDNAGYEPLPPLEENGMETEPEPDEHVERHQVSCSVFKKCT